MAFEVGDSNSKKVVADKMIVLIVDDDPSTRMINKASLSRFGFKTFTVAENDKQVVELCQSGGNFDIITMNFQMPLMDGIETTKLLTDMGVDYKIIAVIADDVTTIERFKDVGIDQFFTKPLYDYDDKTASFLKNM